LSHTLFGLVGPDETNQYLLFVDLDNDPTTGGAPAKLGFSTAFEGAELVTRVVVEPGRKATATVWTFAGTDFAEVKDPGIHASVDSAVDDETETPVFDVVTAEVPLDVVGKIAPSVRVQAIAEQGQGNAEFDILPGDTDDRASKEAAELFLVQPQF